MALELLLADLDAADVDRAREPRAVAALDPRLVIGEAAAEGGHAGVLDGEADRRMDRVDDVVRRRYRLLDRPCGHFCFLK